MIKDKTKTGKESFILLLKIPIKILQKHEEIEFSDNRLLPYNACQNMNIYICKTSDFFFILFIMPINIYYKK